MIERNTDIWSVDLTLGTVWIGITTNGSIRQDGCLVMGRGVAAQAKERFKGLDSQLGKLIKASGNWPYFLPHRRLFTFPVKTEWNHRASLSLIQQSAARLREKAKVFSSHTFYLPRPGCGNGGLKWDNVRPLLLDLPDNVVCVTNTKGVK